MKLGDLTTLANVKVWLVANSYALGENSTDAIISSLIPRVSQSILNYIERPWILPRSYSEIYNPGGSSGVVLRNWPVLSVDSLYFFGQVISPASNGRPPGYLLDTWDGIPPGRHQSVSLLGSRFGSGPGLSVQYTAGYQVTDEAAVIPAPVTAHTTSVVSLLQPYGIWGSDISVTYDDGTLLTQVSAPPTVAGTYYIRPPDVGTPLEITGQYEFFTGVSGDTDRVVLITYGFVPRALEQAAIEMTCERLLARLHIGEVSRAVNQQVTTRYDVSEMPARIKLDLKYFRNVLPI